MQRAVLVLMALAACPPRGDYTPRIDVEPKAAERICYVCYKTGHGACSPEVEQECAMIFSDVKAPGRRIMVEDEEDAPSP